MNKCSRNIFRLGIFILLLLYFVFNSGWYAPSKLIVTGKVKNPDATLEIGWESGEGRNPYESETFSFLSAAENKNGLRTLTVTGSDEKNKLSKNRRVMIVEIRFDDIGKHIPNSALQNVRRVRGHGWILDSSNSKLAITHPAKEHISILFKTSSNAGIAKLSVDQHNVEHDLFRSNWEILFSKVDFWFLDEEGRFSICLDMPRYHIEKLHVGGKGVLELTSVELQTADNLYDLYQRKGLTGGQLTVEDPLKEITKYFHLKQFTFQLVFAAFGALILWFFVQFVAGRVKVQKVLKKEQWRFFWAIFYSAIAVYSFWLAAFWPGVMSVDSLNIWRAALLPEVMINNHPFINEIYYMFFQQFWNNMAVVPCAQILLLSLLIASTFTYTYHCGVAKRYLIPCYLLLIFSVPVGLYNVTLWKDIPFALLVIFWSLALVYLFMRKKEDLQLSWQIVVVLLILFVALLLFRHNGMVYLFVVPGLLLALGLVRINKSILFTGALLGGALLYFVVNPPYKNGSGSYFHHLSRAYIEQIKKESPSARMLHVATNYPRILDLKKNEKQSDYWHYYLYDRYAYPFLKDVGWNDAFPYVPMDRSPFPKLRQLGLSIYHVTLDYPWLYFSWYIFPWLYILPLAIVFYRWFPRSAIFSVMLLSQTFVLLFFVGTTNWRYYYFLHLGGYFILPMILLDHHFLKKKRGT